VILPCTNILENKKAPKIHNKIQSVGIYKDLAMKCRSIMIIGFIAKILFGLPNHLILEKLLVHNRKMRNIFWAWYNNNWSKKESKCTKMHKYFIRRNLIRVGGVLDKYHLLFPPPFYPSVGIVIIGVITIVIFVTY